MYMYMLIEAGFIPPFFSESQLVYMVLTCMQTHQCRAIRHSLRRVIHQLWVKMSQSLGHTLAFDVKVGTVLNTGRGHWVIIMYSVYTTAYKVLKLTFENTLLLVCKTASP
jgi:hypothetical protein